MKWPHAVAALVLVVVAVVATTKASSTSLATLDSLPCNAASLAGAYSGPLKVESVQNFGCQGPWAYLWATVGTGEQAIGVTETLHFNATSRGWRNASRLTYCVHDRLPAYVRFWGCNSN